MCCHLFYSLNLLFVRFTHVTIQIQFIHFHYYMQFHQVNIPRYFHSFIDRNLDQFGFSAIIMLHEYFCVSLYAYTGVFKSYLPRSETAELQAMCNLVLIDIAQLFFTMVYNFYSHQQCLRVPLTPHSHQYLVLSDFLIFANLISVK